MSIFTVQERAITLTILIPSFERAYFVRNVLDRFVDSIKSGSFSDVEILVSDNCSSDDTESIVRQYQSVFSFVRYFRQSEHSDSGEENIFRALPQCRGEYVWTFSDDDVPGHDAIGELLPVLRTRDYSFILTNPGCHSVTDCILATEVVACSADMVEIPIDRLIAVAGVVTLGCCFSAVICRRDDYAAVDWRFYRSISPIYSHVFVYLEAFREKRCIFLNRGLFSYRVGGTGEGGWRLFAERRRQPFRFPWSIGLVRLIRLARDKGFVPNEFIYDVVEHDLEGPFLLSHQTIWEIAAQMVIWLDKKLEHERVTLAELDEYLDLFSFGPQSFIEVLYGLRQIVRVLALTWPETSEGTPSVELSNDVRDLLGLVPSVVADGFRQSIESWAHKRLGEIQGSLNGRAIRSLIREDGGYIIYLFGSRYVAVRKFLESVDFSAIDFGAMEPDIVIDKSPGALRRRLAGNGIEAQLATMGYKLKACPDGCVAVRKEIQSINPQSVVGLDRPPAIVVARDQGQLLSRVWEMHLNHPDTVASLPSAQHSNAQLSRTMLAVYFDQDWYLSAYPDAANRVAAGEFDSALSHYCAVGITDKLNPSVFFSDSTYSAVYGGVANAIGTGKWRSGYEFYVVAGRYRGYNPSIFFDDIWYRASYPAVGQLVGDGRFVCGFDHYLAVGCREGLNPNAFYDELWYLRENPHVGDQIKRGLWRCGYQQYLAAGHISGRDPCLWFSQEKYLATNSDVALAIAQGRIESSYIHWLAFGRNEGRSTGTP